MQLPDSAGTGDDEATSSLSRTSITFDNDDFDGPEDKLEFVRELIAESGIPDSGLGRRKNRTANALAQHSGLYSTADNMLEDALDAADDANAGGTGPCPVISNKHSRKCNENKISPADPLQAPIPWLTCIGAAVPEEHVT